MSWRSRFFKCAVVAMSLTVVTTASLPAGTLTWVPTASGTYSWATGANWSPDGVPDDVANLNINILGDQTVTLDAAITLNRLNIGDAESLTSTDAKSVFTLAGDATRSLTLNGPTGISMGSFDLQTGPTATISAKVIMGVAQTWSIGKNSTLNLTGDVSGAHILTKTGSGTLGLDGIKSFSGGTIINDGVVRVSSLQNVGTNDSLGSGTITISKGNLSYVGTSAVTTDRQLLLTGTSATLSNGSDKTRTMTWTSALSGAAGLTTSLSLNSRAAINEYRGVLSDGAGGTLNLIVNGGAGWLLTGENTYTGNTYIGSGTNGYLYFTTLKDTGAGPSSLGNPTGSNATIRLGGDNDTGGLVYVGTDLNGVDSNRPIQIGTSRAGTEAGGILSSNGTGAFVLRGDVTLNTAHDRAVLWLRGNNTSVTNELSGAIGESSTGTLRLVLDNNVTWRLSGANTYNGTTTVSLGTLIVTKPEALPNYTTAGQVSVSAGATLAVGAGGSDTWDAASIGSLLGTSAFATNARFGIEVTEGRSFTYGDTGSVAISGAKAFQKLGSGTLVLTGTHDYTGTTTISAGTLVAATPDALPNYTTADKVKVSAGATLAVRAGGSGEWDATSIGGLLGTANVFATNARFGIDVAEGRSFTYGSGTLSGDRGFDKLGGGSLVLTGTQGYSGSTRVSAGTLEVHAGGAIAGGATVDGTDSVLVVNGTANGGATVGNGGTLKGNGTIGGGITIEAGGTLAPGASAGVMHSDGNLNQDGRLQIEVTATSLAELAQAGVGYDQVQLLSGALNSKAMIDTASATLDLVWDTSLTLSADEKAMLVIINNLDADIDQTQVDGHFKDLENGSRVASIGGTDWFIYYNVDADASIDALIGSTGNDVVLTSVPEPSTVTLLAGATVALAGWFWRSGRKCGASNDGWCETEELDLL